MTLALAASSLGPFRLLAGAPSRLNGRVRCSCRSLRLRAGLALPPASAVDAVRVLFGVLVAGGAMSLARVAGYQHRDTLSGYFAAARIPRPSLVDGEGHRFPVRRILAGAVLTGIATLAFRIAVVARVINRLARLKWSHQLREPVAMRGYRSRLVIELAVVLRCAASLPRPAVVGSALIYLGEVLSDARVAAHVRLACQRITVLHKFLVVGITESLGTNLAIAVFANSHNTIMAHLRKGGDLRCRSMLAQSKLA